MEIESNNLGRVLFASCSRGPCIALLPLWRSHRFQESSTSNTFAPNLCDGVPIEGREWGPAMARVGAEANPRGVRAEINYFGP